MKPNRREFILGSIAMAGVPLVPIVEASEIPSSSFAIVFRGKDDKIVAVAELDGGFFDGQKRTFDDATISFDKWTFLQSVEYRVPDIPTAIGKQNVGFDAGGIYIGPGDSVTVYGLAVTISD